MRVLLALGLAAISATTGATVSRFAPVIKAVKAELSDPYSAQIHSIKQTGTDAFCGWVNAKNTMGGYGGDQLFYDDAGVVQLIGMSSVYNMDDQMAGVARLSAGDYSEHHMRLTPLGEKVSPCIHDRTSP